MAEPFVGEIRVWAGSYAPRGYAFCDGQLLPIVQTTSLFSILGTTFGGDGRTTLGLPDLQGRAPMHPGRGPGLTPRRLGQKGGQIEVTLTDAQMPAHAHALLGTNAAGGLATPVGNRIARSPDESAFGSGAGVAMAADALGTTGGGQPHGNLQPFLSLTFIIALQGVYPDRS